MSLSTHVLDAAHGRPASGVAVRIDRRDAGGGWAPHADGVTDADGRVRWPAGEVAGEPGVHRAVFDTGAFFAATSTPTFYPEVAVVFEVVDASAHHHVPLLLSPYAYSTYRGS